MTYQEQTGDLAGEVSGQVAAALALYVAGNLTAEALIGVVAAYVAAGNTGAAALGDLSLAAAVTIATGVPAAPIGITRPTTEPERLTRSATTILADLDPADEIAVGTAAMRYQRLVESEIRKSVADAYAEGITKSGTVTGWVRGLEPDACQLCRWWWREGRVWPADHPIPRHQGCDCSQIITTTTEPIAEPNQRKRRVA